MPSSFADNPENENSSVEESKPTSQRSRNALTIDHIDRRGAGQAPVEDDEHSPLLSPVAREEDGFLGGPPLPPPPAQEEVDYFQATKSVWYLILLTISIGGLQIAWSVELSNGSPYLLSLGLSKSLMALVWIAGPLTGTLVQPYIGMLSDNCRVRWGKRKPFMLGGAAGTIVSFIFLSWTKEIVAGILGIFGADPKSDGVKTTTIVVAVIWVYVLDFAINTVQAAIRAFILDCAPSHQQEAANSMASRITGVGNIIGYIAGFIDLPKHVGWLGDTQFKDLCAIASVALGATVILSCLVIRERDPRLEGPPAKGSAGVISFFRRIFASIKRLPPQTKNVCIVEFCAWVGFFPMLFYTSSYIGEIYAEPFLEENPDMTPEELDRLYEKATRVGTFALLIFAITSLATNVFLPFLILPTYDSSRPPAVSAPAPGEGPASSLKGSFGENKKQWLDYLVIPGFTLRRAWMYSQILFFCAMFCTPFVRSVPAATTLVGLVGITWALTLWAPWAIISAEVSRRDTALRAQKRQGPSPSSAVAPSLDGYSDHGGDLDYSQGGEAEEEREGGGAEQTDQAGVILGIHNMSIASPQIIATVGSSIIFRLLQKPRGKPGDHSIAIVMALGGVFVLASAWFIHRIRDEPTVPADDLAAVEEGGVPSASGPGGYERLPLSSA